MSSQLLDGRGIITVLNIPFNTDLSIDRESYVKGVEYAYNAGVKGILVPAMASEVLTLTPEEKIMLVTTAKETVRNNIPVIAGTSSTVKEERYSNYDKFMELGCTDLLVSIPGGTEAEYMEELKYIDSLKPSAIVLQDWDSAGYGLSPKFIMKLAEEIESFKVLKVEVVSSGLKYTEMKSLLGDRIKLAGGWAVTQMIEGLERGVDYFMPTAMHDVYVRIFDLFDAGKTDEAEALFEKIQPILSYSNQHLDISIHFFKRMLNKLGIYKTDCLRKEVHVDDINIRIADKLIERYRKLSASLK